MVTIKSVKEIENMRIAGRIVAETLKLLQDNIEAGITTLELSHLAEKYIKSCGAVASFKNYNGFPECICTSINEELIHGIPSSRKLKNGDVISIDVGAIYNGYHGDAARTFAVGTVSNETQRLIDITKQSFFQGLTAVKPDNRLVDIAREIQRCAETNGYSVVREYCGHGIGSKLHEDPNIPNYVCDRPGIRLKPGMTLAIEPMVNAGARYITVDKNGIVSSKDGKLTAHYENTVLVTKGEPQILTILEGAE